MAGPNRVISEYTNKRTQSKMAETPRKRTGTESDVPDRAAKLIAFKTRIAPVYPIAPTLKMVIDSVRRGTIFVQPMRMLNANAVHSSGGKSFSDAYCDIIPHEDVAYTFGSLFKPGIRVLREYTQDDTKLPENEIEQLLLLRLLNYLDNKELHEALFMDEMEEFNEAQGTAVLAEHLLSQLGASSEYVMDSALPSRPQTCPCLECGASVTDKYGDTSMGHRETWHGSVDIVLKNEEIVAHYIGHTGDNESPGGEKTGEVNKSFDKNKESVYCQMVAETIVFAFIQIKRHPSMSSFLIPSIGISKEECCFFFYDAEQDVLLKSSNHELDRRRNFEYCVVLLWLVINYKYFCNGLSGLKVNVPKSGFFEIAKEKIELYRNKLKVGKIARRRNQKELLISYEAAVHFLGPDLNIDSD